MDKQSRNQTILTWDNEFGQFRAIIWDGELTDFRVCENGSNITMVNHNVDFLKEVRRAIDDTINELEPVMIREDAKSRYHKPTYLERNLATIITIICLVIFLVGIFGSIQK